MTPARRLIAVGRALWPVSELAANTLGVSIHHCTDLFLPSVLTPGAGPPPAWWMPCAYAARLRHSGVQVDLAAPGPQWLSAVPEQLLGRQVHTGTVDQLRGGLGRIPVTGSFVKLAEAKHDTFPAAWRTREQLAGDLDSAGLPGSSWAQWTPTRLDLAVEYRTYVHYGRVIAHSLYLRTEPDGTQVTYYDGARLDAGEAAEARDFAGQAAQVIEGRRLGPAAYVLDVGYDRARRRWVVVEGNPAWSSAWYGCDIDSVVTAIMAACAPGRGWEYDPDPVYVQAAARKGPLR